MTAKYETPTWQKIKIMIAATECLICLGCLLFTIYTRCLIGNRQRRAPKLIPVFTLLSLCFLLISSIGLGGFYLKWCGTGSTQENTTAIILFRSASLCWSLGHFCSYLVFLLRLRDTFSDTAYMYEVSRSTLLYLVTLLILYETGWFLKCAVPIVIWHTERSTQKKAGEINWTQIYVLIPILILDVVITISMTYMFITRLFMVMRGQAQFVHERYLRADALNRSLNAHGSNQRLMNLSVKITVLSLTSLSSTLIFVSFDALSLYLNGLSMLLYVDLFLQIDTVITCLCLTLFLLHTERVYRVLCCCCNALVYRWMRHVFLRNEDFDDISFEPRSSTSLGISCGPLNVTNINNDPVLMNSENKPSHGLYPTKYIV